MSLKIKEASIRDAENLQNMILESIDLVEDGVFSKKQVDAMRDYWSAENIKNYICDGKWMVFILVEGSQIKGTISFENGMLFSPYIYNSKVLFDGKHAVEMLNFMENFAKQNNFKKLSLICMALTRDFFVSQGFRVVESFNPVWNGEKFDEFRMEKKIK